MAGLYRLLKKIPISNEGRVERNGGGGGMGKGEEGKDRSCNLGISRIFVNGRNSLRCSIRSIDRRRVKFRKKRKIDFLSLRGKGAAIRPLVKTFRCLSYEGTGKRLVFCVEFESRKRIRERVVYNKIEQLHRCEVLEPSIVMKSNQSPRQLSSRIRINFKFETFPFFRKLYLYTTFSINCN